MGGPPSPLHRNFLLKSSGFDQLIEGDVISYLGCCWDSVVFTSVLCIVYKKAVISGWFYFFRMHA